MRWRLVVAGWLVLSFSGAPAVFADSPSEVLLDWQQGLAAAGAPAVPVWGVNVFAWDVWLDGCHRSLRADLLFAPAGVGVDTEPAGVFLPFQFEISVSTVANGTGRTISDPGFGWGLGLAPAAGWANVTLWLVRGAAVEWEFRLRGWEAFEEPECEVSVLVNEVEANPAGNDTGAEWVELYNPRSYDVNLSGWVLSTTHGVTERLTLPDGTSIPRYGHLVVALPGQFLDNVGEEVLLLRPEGTEMDRTPVLSDQANDNRSWQRVPDGGANWTFLAATPGAGNGNASTP